MKKLTNTSKQINRFNSWLNTDKIIYFTSNGEHWFAELVDRQKRNGALMSRVKIN